jgi:hypothetical protein
VQGVEKLLGPKATPFPNANAVATPNCASAIRQQLALINDAHLRLERAARHERPELRGLVAKDHHVRTQGTSAAPPRWERNDGSILGDHRRDDAKTALNDTELDKSSARREDELGAGADSLDVPGSDRQPIVRVQERSIDVAEEGNSRKT